jgi:hypothetical protein
LVLLINNKKQLYEVIMKKIGFILFLFFVYTLTFTDKIVPLPDLMKPQTISLDDSQMYITEDTTVFIYSLKDFKLIKKFGKTGEGPEEFMKSVIPSFPAIPLVAPTEKHLIICSLGKISFYTKDGTYIRELKTASSPAPFPVPYRPVKSGFVGQKFSIKDNIAYFSICLFDKDLKNPKELLTLPVSNKAGKQEVLRASFDFRVYEDGIFLTGKKGFTIDVCDSKGDHQYSITQPYVRRKFTSEDEKVIREALKFMLKDLYEQIKNNYIFPTHFPEILALEVSEDKLYVITWKVDNENFETFIFDLKGKLLKKTFIQLRLMDKIRPYPYVINKGKLYHLVENEDEELWELQISKII